jgi:hypothetical protein
VGVFLGVYQIKTDLDEYKLTIPYLPMQLEELYISVILMQICQG